MGANPHGVACGGIGDVGIYSFDAVKNLAMGEGGGLTAKDPARIARAGTSSMTLRVASAISSFASSDIQILWRCKSLRPITMRWISEVPSPINSSGASR